MTSTRSLVLAMVLLTSCKFNEITIPNTPPMVVVHAVLNPSSLQQVVLLERSLTGAATIPDTVFDPNNPIATAGGVPISAAEVLITDDAGVVTRGIEDKIGSTGTGTGVYRLNFRSPIQGGGQYALHIETQDGEIVTASTRVPEPTTTSTGALTQTFNRDHDTLSIQWPAAASTRTYAIRIESPFGPFFLFNDSTRFHIAGNARNLFSSDLRRLFVPGFRQAVLVVAVDSNFYDYYRTNNDPFTGSGIISRINGGIGLFGSVVSLTTGTLNVTADQTEPIEGRYRLTPPGSDTSLPSIITLYLESKSTRPDVPDALSGRYSTPGGPTGRSDGIVGQQTGTHVSFAILANQLASDTVEVWDGVLSGDTLTGQYRKHIGTYVFVKQ